jgi:hypothetical protein
LKQGEIAGYTDTENPFGDANLTERFVWWGLCTSRESS